MERLPILADQTESPGDIINVHKIIILGPGGKLRRFATQALLDRSINQPRAALSRAISIRDFRPNKFNPKLCRHRHTHDMGNQLSSPINITWTGSISLGIGRCHCLMLHNAARAQHPLAAQLFSCAQNIHRPLCVLKL